MVAGMPGAEAADYARAMITEDLRPSRLAEALRRVARLGTPLTVPLAGRRYLRLWAVVHHRGRRSGRSYTATVAIRATPDGFVIPLPFTGAQWFRNLLAAGEGMVRWNGRDHRIREPQLLQGAAGASAFNPVQRAILRVFGIDRFLSVRTVD